MATSREKRSIESWDGQHIPSGKGHDLMLAVGETYSGSTIHIPIHIRRAEQDGPTVFVSAALHGDEINGTGAIRHLIQDDELELVRGAVIFAPVLNILGFDRHSRYLPDRRDSQSSFPRISERKSGEQAWPGPFSMKSLRAVTTESTYILPRSGVPTIRTYGATWPVAQSATCPLPSAARLSSMTAAPRGLCAAKLLVQDALRSSWREEKCRKSSRVSLNHPCAAPRTY